MNKAIGKCPEAIVSIGMVPVRCLPDTGAQVSTITESFFDQHLKGTSQLVDTGPYIQITAANGWSVPYVGYTELDIRIMGKIYPKMGFLIVKESGTPQFAARKKLVPGVIGSNIFQVIQDSGKDNKTCRPRGKDSALWCRIL
jgi:hypothetical protein